MGLGTVVKDDALRVLLQQRDQHRRFALQAGGQGGVAHLHFLICKAVRKAVGPCCGAHTVLGHVRPIGQPVKVGTAAQHHGCGSQRAGAAPALLEVEACVHVQIHCQCSGQTGKQKGKAQYQGQQSFSQGVRCGGIHGSVFPFLFLCGSHRDLLLKSIPACNPFVNNLPSIFSISTRFGDIRWLLFTNFSAIFHASDKISSYPPHKYEKIFLFSPVFRVPNRKKHPQHSPCISLQKTGNCCGCFIIYASDRRSGHKILCSSCTRSPITMGLDKKPFMPLSSALRRSSSKALAVMAMIGSVARAGSSSARIFRVAV